jgi:serine/threonine-protein kinase
MKISAPIITLLAGGALAGGLIVANSVTAGGTATSTAVQVAEKGAAADDGAKAAADEKAAKDKAAAEAAADQGAADQGAAQDEAAAGAAAGGAAAQPGGAAAEDAQEKVRRTYAGRVKGGGPLLAISVRDGVAVAYLCDGKLEAWFKGTAKAGRLTLTGKKGGELTGTFNADRAKGSVTVGQRQWDFQTPTVKKPSGLWKATAEVRGARVEGGWVVLEDGTQVGTVTRNGVPTTAPLIDPAAGRVTIDGQLLTVVATDSETGAGF